MKLSGCVRVITCEQFLLTKPRSNEKVIFKSPVFNRCRLDLLERSCDHCKRYDVGEYSVVSSIILRPKFSSF